MDGGPRCLTASIGSVLLMSAKPWYSPAVTPDPAELPEMRETGTASLILRAAFFIISSRDVLKPHLYGPSDELFITFDKMNVAILCHRTFYPPMDYDA